MLLEEARWVSKRLATIGARQLYPMANIGSSTEHFRQVVQPYIDQYLFVPARARNDVVVHVDTKEARGVDLVGDVTDPATQERLRALSVKSVLCCNLLEHVTDRQRVCQSLMAAINPGGYIIVSVPYDFPYHEDPIDTLFRPTIAELAGLFPGAELRGSALVRASRFRFDMHNDYIALLKLLIRVLVPWYKPRNWMRAVRHLRDITKGYRVTCLVLRKTAATKYA